MPRRSLISRTLLWLAFCLFPCSCTAHGTGTPKVEILRDIENLSILAGSAVVTLIVSMAARSLIQWVARCCSRHLHLLQTGFENFAFNLVILALILANIGVALKILNRQFFSLVEPKLIDRLEGRLEQHMNDNPWGWTVACVLVSYAAAEAAKRLRSSTKRQENAQETELSQEDTTTTPEESSQLLANPAPLSPTLPTDPIPLPVLEKPPSHVIHPPGWSVNAPPPPSFLAQAPATISGYDPLAEGKHTGGGYDPMIEGAHTGGGYDTLMDGNAMYPPPLPSHLTQSGNKRKDSYGPVLPPPLPSTFY